MQDSLEEVQGQMMGQMSNVCPLGNTAEVCHCLAAGRPQWSPAATMNVVRAGEWVLLPNPSSWHRAWLSKHTLSPQQMITDWLSVQGSYLNMPAQLRRKLFFFHIFDSCFASEQIYSHTRRKQSLVLLPLQCLWEKKSTWVLLRSGPDCSDKAWNYEPSRPNHLWPSKHNISSAILCPRNTGWSQGRRGLWETTGPCFYTYFLIGVSYYK